MKPIKYLYPLFILIFTPLGLFAQLVGRGSSSQDPGKEIKAQEINAGSVSGDVNLFTGTYNMSYPVGSVSTLSGLSYTATLNYSSTFASGDNQPHLSGVPYGEGWNLDIPTISVSTEDFNKYTLTQMETFSQSNPPVTPKTPTFTNFANPPNCDEAKEEGRLYWFAPTINIPGIASGRTVYKKKDGNEYVFVLNRFERYIEARLDLSTLRWRVIIDDGTEYHFYYLSMSHRNPANQRIQQVCQNADNLKQLILPKSEITTWYCDFIRHPNHVDMIKFSYRTFGTFEQFKLFKGGTGWASMVQNYLNIYVHSNFLPKAVKDIFISKIYTARDSLVFNYSTIATTGGVNLPDGTFANFDDLYATKTAKIYDFGSTFASWRRYNHIRSDNLSTSCDRHANLPFESALNPYLVASYPGGPGVANGYLTYKTVPGSPTSLPFDHGYLESPKIGFSTFIPGETYELKVDINNYNGDFDCLFDINVATGDNQVIFPSLATTTYNSNSMLYQDCWSKSTGESIFTTFNQGVKWGVQYGFNATGSNGFTNFFQMPNLPTSHNGIYVQVGPGSSDTRFDKDPLLIVNATNNPNMWATYLQAPIVQEQNDDNQSAPNAIIRSGASIPNNFGVGAPWFMLQNKTASNPNKSFYDYFGDATGGPTHEHWWNDKKLKDGTTIPNCSAQVQWKNRPTRTTENTKLEKVEFIRYAKKPYMLQTVLYKVKNAAQAFVTVSKLEFSYEIKQLATYAAAFQNDPSNVNDRDLVNNTGRYRNVVLLNGIVQKAPDGTTLAASQTPTTKFSYKKIDLVPTTFLVNQWRSDLFPINANCYALEQITDPLGQKTVLEYYPMPRQTDATFSSINVKQPDSLSYMVTNFRYRPRPAELKVNPNYVDCNTCTYPIGHPANGHPSWNIQMGKSQAYQIFLVVKHKKVTDRGDIEKIWKYQPDSIIYNFMDRPYFSENYVYDFTNNSIQAGFKKMVVTGPNPTSVGGPVNTYRHMTSNILWGKMHYAEEKTASGNLVSVKRMNYQSLLAFDKPWASQNPVSHPDFTAITALEGGQTKYITLDMPYFYETRNSAAIEASRPNYMKSYFVKLSKDSTTTYHQGGSNLVVTEYEYFDANNLLSTTSPGYQAILGGSLPITLTFEPSWQLYRTKSYSTEYTGANALYTQGERFYLYDLANKSSYQSGGAVNSNFRNLWFVWNKNMRTVEFESRNTSKTSFTDGAKVISRNTVLKKFSETGADPLTGYLLPAAVWQQVDSTANQTVTTFESTLSFKEKVNWKYLRTDSFYTYSTVNLSPTHQGNAKGLRTTHAYDTYTGLPTSRTVGFTLSDAITTAFAYNTDNTLASETVATNNLVISYVYDKLKRLSTVSRNTQILKRYVYNQFNSVTPSANFQSRTNANYVRETQYTTAVDSFLTYSYSDALGRPAATIRDGQVLENKIYDVWNRVIYQLKPAAGSTPATSIPATPSNHLQYALETAPRNRLMRSAKYGEPIATGKVVQNRYTIIQADSLTTLLTQAGLTGVSITGTKFFNETTLDEDNKIIRSITNLFGQKVAEITGNGAAATVFYYNNSGVPNKVINPQNQATKFYYNYPGMLYKKESVDDGTVWYAYNQTGQLIADRNTLNEVRIFKYDNYDRVTQQTFLPLSVNSDPLFTDRGLPWIADPTLTNYTNLTNNANARVEKKWFYNGYDAGTFSLFTTTIQNFLNADNQFNTHGRVAQTITYNLAGTPTQIQLLSYTADGFVDWETLQFNQAGITSGSKGIAHFLDYPSYNRAGSLITQNVDVSFDNTMDMQYTYAYDKRNRLKEVYVSYTDVGTNGRKIVSYEYDNATDLLLRKFFYGRLPDGTCVRTVDTITYTYDARYRLTAMNSKTLDYNLAYDGNQTANSSGQTLSTNYNGNINGIYANYKLAFAGTVPLFKDGTVYTYTYDAFNRLTGSDAKIGVHAFLASLTTNQKLFGDNTFTFDKIGNFDITSIWLFNGSNQAVETKWKYNYTTGKNTISNVQDITGTPVVDRTLTHDLSGRLTADSKKLLQTTTYRPSNLVWSHAFNTTPTAKTVNYLYDMNNQRLYKELLNGTTPAVREYYLHSVHGREIAIIDLLSGAAVINSWYVHGVEREARFPHQRYNTTTSGLHTGNPGGKFKNAAAASDALELEYPLRLYMVSDVDTIRPLGYLLDEEVEESTEHFMRLREVVVQSPGQHLFCTDTLGGQARVVTMQQVLDMRAAGESFYLEGFSTDCITEESAMLPPPTMITPRFYIYDHLGNARVVYYCSIPTDCGATVYNLEYVADYSPYGRVLRSWIASGASERYLTTQHERDGETGYDNRGARLYDSELGRFLTLDPMAAKYYAWSAFNYVMGNPIQLIDPDGRNTTSTHVDADGKVLAVYNDGDLNVYVHNKESKSHWSDTGHLPKEGYGVYVLTQTSKWDDHWNNLGKDFFAKQAEIQENEGKSAGANEAGSAKDKPIDFSNFALEAVGAVMDFGEAAMPNGSTYRLFNQKGTNFSPKIYDSGWRGGSAGQIKTYSTGNLRTGLKIGGIGLGIFNAYQVNQQHQKGEISDMRMYIEQGSNVFSTFGGIYGAAWGIGWEGGRLITQIPGYHENVRVPLQKAMGLRD